MREQLSGWSPFEMLAAAVIGAIVAGAAAVGLVGGIAGALFGAGWPEVHAADLPAIARRVPEHLADPSRAWPMSVRTGLPGAAGFLAALAIALIGALALALLVWRLYPRNRHGARWAAGRALKVLRVAEPDGRRLVLGRSGGGLLAAEARESVIVVAPTQTGKTTGIAIPALLEWEGPVLATSIKTDLVIDTLSRRRALGDVKVFDPTTVTGLERSHWSPLSACCGWQHARETAGRLCSLAHPARGVQDADFWTGAAARYLAPLLFCAAHAGATMSDVLRWVETNEQDELKATLAQIQFEAGGGPGYQFAQAAFAALESVWEADERLRSSLMATAAVALDAYGDPVVAEASVRFDITPEWLLSGPNTVFLCATATAQERLAPLFVTLVDEVVAHVYAKAARTGRPLESPLLVVLDEAANIAPLPRLDQLAATGAGQGLQLVTVVQDLAQVEARWGRKADTILNNHRAKLFGTGLSCERTLTYLTRVLGDQTLTQRSATRGETGRRSVTEGTHYRPLAPIDELRQGRPGTGVLVYGHLPPARICFRPWYAERRLRRLAERSQA
jgi:type IV secretion system protein VirD4